MAKWMGRRREEREREKERERGVSIVSTQTKVTTPTLYQNNHLIKKHNDTIHPHAKVIKNARCNNIS